MQADEQDTAWECEEGEGEGEHDGLPLVQGHNVLLTAGLSIHADGECAGVPCSCQEVRSARGGGVPDPRPVRGQEYSPGGALPLLPGQSHSDAPRVLWASDRTQDVHQEREELLRGADQTGQGRHHWAPGRN